MTTPAARYVTITTLLQIPEEEAARMGQTEEERDINIKWTITEWSREHQSGSGTQSMPRHQVLPPEASLFPAKVPRTIMNTWLAPATRFYDSS